MTSTSRKLRKGDKFPLIQTDDIFGRPLEVATSKRLLVSFMRNIDCIFCNYQIHLFNEAYQKFRATETEVIIFMQSTAEDMRIELTSEVFDMKFPYRLVADPEKEFYGKIGAEASWLKYARVITMGLPILRAMRKGFKLKLLQRGEQHLLPADFLINKHGVILNAHYGKHVADHMAFEEIFDLSH